MTVSAFAPLMVRPALSASLTDSSHPCSFEFSVACPGLQVQIGPPSRCRSGPYAALAPAVGLPAADDAARGSGVRGPGSRRPTFRITLIGCGFARSAFKHGVSREAIVHAVAHALTSIELDPDADPPKVLAIGPDPSGNLLEVIWLEFDEVEVVIHAMALRPVFYDLLP